MLSVRLCVACLLLHPGCGMQEVATAASGRMHERFIDEVTCRYVQRSNTMKGSANLVIEATEPVQLVKSSIKMDTLNNLAGIFRSIMDTWYAFLDQLWSVLTMQKIRQSIGDTISHHTPHRRGSKPPPQLTWAGVPATQSEWDQIDVLWDKIRLVKKRSKWMNSATDIELLRFLRECQGDTELAWKMITSHAKWRTSTYGADSSFTSRQLANYSPLHEEIFWLGKNSAGVPVLVVRTQVHDGLYYDHDPRIYASYLVALIEKGKQQYGVGVTTQMCVLMDRGGLLVRDGVEKVEVLDMGVVPRLVDLCKHVVTTIKANYPDILHSAKIAPASWFFLLCYRITGRAMDPITRSKFEVLTERDLPTKLHNLLSPTVLPQHLGGCSSSYTSTITVHYKSKKK